MPIKRRTFIAQAVVVASLLKTRVASGQEATAVPDTPALPGLPEASPRPEGPLGVVTTTPILADFTRQVGGARVAVESLVPANADAHDFEPAPEDVIRLEAAALVIQNGLDLDGWAADLLEAAGDRPVVTAADGVALYAGPETEAVDGDEHGRDVDPHVWLDPANAKVMAANVAGGLASVDEAGRADYEARRLAYDAQVNALDGWIAAQIATIPPERRKLVTSHDAFGYFARRYGLTLVGTVIPGFDTQAEPSAQEIAELIERIRAEQAPAIFTEVSIDPRLEAEIAAQAGVVVVSGLYADTLGDPGSGAETYIGMMIANTRLIVGALRPPQ